VTSWPSLEEHPKTERNTPKDIHLTINSATSEIYDKSTHSSSDRTTATIMYARQFAIRRGWNAVRDSFTLISKVPG
jgi:hypothetical protein